jgi:uncharacterized membrane protein YphA (DoxX/SURF4 family)
MAKKKAVFDAGTTLLVLQIVVAAFLITLGLVGLIHWNSDPSRFGRGLTRAFGGTNNPFSLIVAIVELVAGLIVLAGAFARVRGRLLFAATLVIAILWAVQIVISFFARDIFEPDFWIWLNRLAMDLIVLLALWLINRKYA